MMLKKTVKYNQQRRMILKKMKEITKCSQPKRNDTEEDLQIQLALLTDWHMNEPKRNDTNDINMIM
jgi:hypothetical protein